VNTNPRLTKQGIRDLNHYGPKPGKVAAEAAPQALAGDAEVAPPAAEKGPVAPLPVDE